jgi:hypothetical protein
MLKREPEERPKAARLVNNPVFYELIDDNNSYGDLIVSLYWVVT